MVGTGGRAELQFLLAARDGDDRRAERLAELDGGGAHRTARAEDRECLARVVRAEGDEAGAARGHHPQRHAGQDPVPAAGQLHHVQLDAAVAVQQRVMGEVDRVLLV